MVIFGYLRDLCSACYPSKPEDKGYLLVASLVACTLKSQVVLGAFGALYALYKYSEQPAHRRLSEPPISKPSQPSTLPPKPARIGDAKFVGNSKGLPSIGIPNFDESSCFLATMMQAHILTNPIVEEALFDPEVQKKLPNTAQFIAQFRKDQKAREEATKANIGMIRHDLFRATDNNRKWLTGQHDAHEAFTVLFSHPAVSEVLRRKNYENTARILYRYWQFAEGVVPKGLPLDNDRSLYYSESMEQTSGTERVSIEGVEENTPIEDLLLSQNEAIEGNSYETQNHGKQTPRYRYTKKKWHKTPRRLSLVLNRFDSNGNRIGTPRNIQDKIVLNQGLFADGRPRRFELISFTVHRGGQSINSGHYVAYVKEGSKWFCYNDDTRTEVSAADIAEARRYAYSTDWRQINL